MSQLFPIATELSFADVPRATQGPESSALDLVGPSATIEKIDRNYWKIRDVRIREERAAVINEIAKEVTGQSVFDGARHIIDRETRNESGAVDASVGQNMSAAMDGVTQELFDEVELRRRYDPGTYGNLPANAEELEAQVNATVASQLDAERAEAEAVIANRSTPNLAGGIASFVGAAAPAITDIEGLATLPAGGPGASFGRRVLMGSIAGAGGEAATLPAYNDQADFLGRDRPNPWVQIGFGAAFGSALPVVGQGFHIAGNTLTPEGRVRNSELLTWGQRDTATALERGASTALARDVATQETAPAGTNPADHAVLVDGVEDALNTNQPVIVNPSETVPTDVPGETPGQTRQLLDLIRQAEAPRGYDQVYSGIGRADQPPKPLTQMTINEVLAWQDSIDARYPSEAAGAYQIMEDTLRPLVPKMGLSGNEVFNEAMQDRLAIALMRGRGLDDYLAGRITADQFGLNLAKEWAGLPVPGGGGRGYYDGDGLNGATIPEATFMELLRNPAAYRPLDDGTRVADVHGFPVGELRTDADAYQYKSGGDEGGVTERLQFEREWDASAAVGVMVHERLDGNRYIADGHQRLGLAKRLTAQGVEGIELQGFVYRESDGWSVPQVRAMAAIRNIRQESGTPLDAAKVIRDFPELAANISRTRGFMSQADGLSRLYPGPFKAMVNDVIPQNYGALVGRIIPDDAEMQSVAIATLAKAEPSNALQAESMVRDIRRMGLERQADADQASLFGDGFDLGETAISERASVLDVAAKELRRDKTVFARLSRENERIEGAGNVLDTQANVSRERLAERALERLIILADQPGPIRDAIDAAARAVRAGTRVADAAADVIDAITGTNRPDRVGADARGADDDGLAPSPSGATDPVDELPAVGSATPEPDLFGDPVESAGAAAQIVQIETDLRARIKADPDADVAIQVMDGDKVETANLSTLMADLDEELEFVEQLKLCTPKGLI